MIDLVSFLFARFNVTFDDAVKRSVPPSALYIYIYYALFIDNIGCSFSCNNEAVLRASPSAGRVSFSFSVASRLGTFHN